MQYTMIVDEEMQRYHLFETEDIYLAWMTFRDIFHQYDVPYKPEKYKALIYYHDIITCLSAVTGQNVGTVVSWCIHETSEKLHKREIGTIKISKENTLATIKIIPSDIIMKNTLRCLYRQVFDV